LFRGQDRPSLNCVKEYMVERYLPGITRYTFAAFEQGPAAGVAVIDHRAGNQVVNSFSYPGRPHGVDLVPTQGDDDEGEDD
jgi:hypothetical protein